MYAAVSECQAISTTQTWACSVTAQRGGRQLSIAVSSRNNIQSGRSHQDRAEVGADAYNDTMVHVTATLRRGPVSARRGAAEDAGRLGPGGSSLPNFLIS